MNEIGTKNECRAVVAVLVMQRRQQFSTCSRTHGGWLDVRRTPWPDPSTNLPRSAAPAPLAASATAPRTPHPHQNAPSLTTECGKWLGGCAAAHQMRRGAKHAEPAELQCPPPGLFCMFDACHGFTHHHSRARSPRAPAPARTFCSCSLAGHVSSAVILFLP